MRGGGMVRPGETCFMFKRKELNIMKDDERWWKMMKNDEKWWNNVIHSGKKRYELAWYRKTFIRGLTHGGEGFQFWSFSDPVWYTPGSQQLLTLKRTILIYDPVENNVEEPHSSVFYKPFVFFHQITWRFPKMGAPQVTMGCNTFVYQVIVIHDLDDLGCH